MKGWMCVIKVACVCLCLVIGLAACEKAPVNRDIEGHWRLDYFTILESDSVVTCDRLFYGIMSKSTLISEKQGTHGYGSFVALTEYREHESVLVLKDFKVYGSAGVDATVEQLLPFGICNREETVFAVKVSTGKRMVLESDYARLELKKF